jgi:coenzyme F420 biosynthesis associated uncharacterized protein
VTAVDAPGGVPVPEPVDWPTARRVARIVAGRDALSDSYLGASLVHDFTAVTVEAEALVGDFTGLRGPGNATAAVLDRGGWVDANIDSMRRLLSPLTERLGARLANSPMAPIGRYVTGTEIGVLLGYVAQRVLGQYDLLVTDDQSGADAVYYVGPNVLNLEKRFAFRPRDFRMWIAIHEVTHRAQFTGVPWLRQHFLSLVERSLDSVEPDPKRFLNALRRVIESSREGRSALEDGGLVALLATPEQGALLQQIGGMMSLLEGHGDVTMDRAGAGLIPSAERFSRVLRQRRQQGNAPAKLLQRLLGFEAKLNQYEQGEKFIAAVEARGGPELLNRAFVAPELLPSLAEIRDPQLWIQRVAVERATAV